MNLKIFLLSFFIASAAMWTPGVRAQTDALAIVQKANDKLRGRSNYSEIKMTIVRPDWTREMQIKGWSLGEDFSLMVVTAPARDKGVAFLKREKEIWNWQPRIDRAIKLPPSMMSQSWMGSDFTNDDLVQQSNLVTDFKHTLLRREQVAGKDCFVVQMVPTAKAAVVWGKIISWIDTEDYMQLKTEFYDEAGFLVNTMRGSDIREFSGEKLPARLEVVPADEPGHKTVVEQLHIDFDVKLDEDFFSIQNLKRLK